MKRWMAVTGLSLAMVVLFGCGKKTSTVPMSETAHNAAGLQWKVPQAWTPQGERMMRVATYTIPMAEGDQEAGECAVFFFGTGQGGDVDMNIERWVSQFQNSPAVTKNAVEINGFKVTKVEIAGTYLAPSGPMMQSQGAKEKFLLLGAIIAAPEGFVFFKSTGPAKTMEGARPAFEALLSSLEKL
jgi:hypothetical protein